jgi:hypothetical protein
MGELDLPVGILEDEGLAALQDAELAAGEPRGVLARPPASTPVMRTPGSSRNSKKSPIALLPPPTHAISSSGSLPSRARIWALASTPITLWKSRTISG